MGTLKDDVKEFWEAQACGERFGAAYEEIRYRFEPEIFEFADFASASGKRVLEIGVGMGNDFLHWVRAGAQASGVDLTERAVRITQQRLAAEGLTADVRVADAESLPYDDATFDIVYSWGVLHHTPNTAKALNEAQRVLAPGGRLKVMLYHRRSWVAFAAWVRFGLLRARPFSTLTQAISHIESPGTKAFVPAEVAPMLSELATVSIRPQLTHGDRKWAPGLAQLFGNRFGWWLLVDGFKSG